MQSTAITKCCQAEKSLKTASEVRLFQLLPVALNPILTLSSFDPFDIPANPNSPLAPEPTVPVLKILAPPAPTDAPSL